MNNNLIKILSILAMHNSEIFAMEEISTEHLYSPNQQTYQLTQITMGNKIQGSVRAIDEKKFISLSVNDEGSERTQGDYQKLTKNEKFASQLVEKAVGELKKSGPFSGSDLQNYLLHITMKAKNNDIRAAILLNCAKSLRHLSAIEMTENHQIEIQKLGYISMQPELLGVSLSLLNQAKEYHSSNLSFNEKVNTQISQTKDHLQKIKTQILEHKNSAVYKEKKTEEKVIQKEAVKERNEKILLEYEKKQKEDLKNKTTKSVKTDKTGKEILQNIRKANANIQKSISNDSRISENKKSNLESKNKKELNTLKVQLKTLIKAKWDSNSNQKFELSNDEIQEMCNQLTQ